MENNNGVMVSATLSIQIDGITQTFSSTVMAMPGQEGFMLDVAWAHTHREAMKTMEENEK